jgi:predicted aconitase with swiveling domain
MSASGADLTGESLHPGAARGSLLVLEQPVSFWGGVDAHGLIVDRHHPQRGTSVVGRVVVMRDGRGSSSASAVLAEQIRSGHAPAALLLGERDAVLLLGALVAAELYGVRMPVVRLEGSALDRLRSEDEVEVHAGEPPGPATVRPWTAAG